MVLSGASAFGSSEAYKPRSKAARSPEVAKFLEKYSFVRFRQAPHTPMPIEAGSLAAKDQQFGLIVMDLRFLNAPATRFAGMLPSAGMSLTAPLLADYVAEKKLA
ncbi:MAG: hypothetical protein EBX52_04875, partial [Proteobacteria bacterium]|nr:hypothetical protein [Pseudomonadota bacterium]